MLQGLYFGAVLNYCSPINGHLTRCVYIREENEKAVVIFMNAEHVARVDFEQLQWRREPDDTWRELKENIKELKG